MLSKTNGTFKFNSISDLDSYIHNFINPLKIDALTQGDLYFINEYKIVFNDIHVNPVYFQIQDINILKNEIYFYQVDSQFHSFNEAKGAYQSHEISFLPIRNYKTTSVLLFCSLELFREYMSILDITKLPSAYLMTDYAGFEHCDNCPSLDFIRPYPKDAIST